MYTLGLPIGRMTDHVQQDTPETPSDEDEDDFEVVPAEPDDATMWDVEDDDEDAAKAAVIKGLYC